ncbi:cortical protein KAR9-domain-containing protein [Bombardia bombarda]|uniref:Cortical protein KAR9-domain-containing protein n=1 Tax=Bombardia bombarda TaxID=252184 RepID=A0AA40BYW5_9PEZI|nr:cortical protein KAR9-domain-containing protein [Bombardia bombarda]
MTSLPAAAPGRSECNNITASTTTGNAGTSAGHADHHHHHHGAGLLTFSDIPSELLQLSSFDAAHQQQQKQQHYLHPTAVSNNLNVDQQQPEFSIPQLPQQSQQPTAQQHQLSANDASAPPPTTPSSAPKHHPRRPSPGLAARLKALGFGARKSASPPPSHYLEIGRLPEEQLRKLDQGHQTNPANPLVERRGRPWKGIVRISSKSSLRSNKSQNRPDPDEVTIYPAADGEANPEFLPAIAASQPLEMDTNKYRLPDHTNGNGVKDTPPIPHSSHASVSHAAQPSTASSNDVFNPDAISYFNPLCLQRPGSIYTLSRASFSNQLAQLTSIQLPDAESLSSKVSAIPTAQAATRALIGAAEQIRGWIYKASEVIGGLESDDDVEWAAAGGREGVEEVENAIIRFEELINVYVGAIEELQGRDDISIVSTDDLRRAVAQMESIMDEWVKVRTTLHHVKAQVEIAMEWEELWNMVLGDIQNEMDDLSRLVFEMEERRHKSLLTITTADGVDIGDLETIVEETPPAASRFQAAANNRYSLPPFPVSPSSPSPSSTGISQDDSSLLALFARMQPLRASLDFLPMRLSVFENRAESIFSTACEELEMRRSNLDNTYRKLEKDAESLRKELGEDRWVLVFRNAGRQASKMYESVERSVARLKEAVDARMHLTNQPMMSSKIENYEGKKTHYGPAIERVLSIIDKGVKDRLTVNGEILRLHTEMQAKWQELKERMAELDTSLEEMQADKKGQQLRDSISSMLSNDRSTVGSGNETPQSSPPSSVIMSNSGLGSQKSAQALKQRSGSNSHLPQFAGRRLSSLPTPANHVPRKPLTPRMSTLSSPSREGSTTPTGNRIPRPASVLGNKPRWNASTNTSDVDTGHNFKPLTLTTPSPYAKRTPTPIRSASALTPSSTSKLPSLRSPLSRAASASLIPEDTPSKYGSVSRLSFSEKLASPGPYSQQTLSRPQLGAQLSASGPNNRRASFQPPRINEPSPDTGAARPASSLASARSGRRTSFLPQPKPGMSVTGRESPQAVAGARFAMMRKTSSSSTDSKGKDTKPRWIG